jgi:hypothetical protein
MCDVYMEGGPSFEPSPKVCEFEKNVKIRISRFLNGKNWAQTYT